MEADGRRLPEPSFADVQAVREQLGRPPRGDWCVARRCNCGLPQVIQTAPRLSDGTPFPTLYWLTCRELSRRVGTLEAERYMATLNTMLRENDDIRHQLERSTSHYVEERDRLGRLDAQGHPGGGPERVKCLHAHVGHHLVSDDNPVGRAVLERLEWQDPMTPCIGERGQV